MKRLSSAVRQLAERHARLQGEAARLEGFAADVATQLARVRDQLAAVSLLLPAIDRRVQPEHIEAITPWKGRYGKRGSLRTTILELLQSAGAQWTSTSHLSLLLRHTFDLAFVSREAQRRWEVRSVRGQLVRLIEQGLVEKTKFGEQHSDEAHWRIAQPAATPSLDDLRAQAEAAGLAVAI